LVGGNDTCEGTSSLHTKVEGIKEKGKVNRFKKWALNAFLDHVSWSNGGPSTKPIRP
jgi:hypothetical protein